MKCNFLKHNFELKRDFELKRNFELIMRRKFEKKSRTSVSERWQRKRTWSSAGPRASAMAMQHKFLFPIYSLPPSGSSLPKRQNSFLCLVFTTVEWAKITERNQTPLFRNEAWWLGLWNTTIIVAINPKMFLLRAFTKYITTPFYSGLSGVC